MAYRVNLSSNQQLILANQGNQTLITLISNNPGQQQSQSSSFTTGNWTSAPQLYQNELGFILRIESEGGESSILIQANSISTITAPVLGNAVPVELENISDGATSHKQSGFEPMKPMKPMKPMQPMKMGNMSMDLNNMSMQMGNLSMNMGEQKAQSKTRFCTQCGAEIKQSDRFCGSCGHKLDF